MKLFGYEITRSKQAQPAPRLATADKWFGNTSPTVNNFWTPPSAFLTAMGVNASGLQAIEDPRLKSQTYITMVATLPEVSRSLKFHAGIMGCPRIEAEGNEAFADEMNAMLNEMRWTGELSYQGDEEYSLDRLVYAMAINTMTLGQSFYTLLDANGDPAEMSRQKIDRIRLHDSERFYYYETEPDKYRLEYIHGGKVDMDVKITNSFRSIRFDSDRRFAWGVPLLYYAEHIAMKAAIKSEMQDLTYRKAASSPTMSIFSIEPMQISDAVHDNIEIMKASYDRWDTESAAIRDNYAKAVKNSYQTGSGADMTASVIGKLNFTTHSAADGLKVMSSYSDDVKLDLSRLVLALNCSPELLGLASGGDGMNSNRSQILMQNMEMYARGLRSTMERHVDYIFRTVAARNSIKTPAKYKWEWEGLSVNDLKARADLEQVEATTQKTWADAMTAMLGAGEVAMAKAFAEENGLDWAKVVNGVTL